jgi:hypothetical protein
MQRDVFGRAGGEIVAIGAPLHNPRAREESLALAPSKVLGAG